MSELHLALYAELETEQLGRQLHHLVRVNQDELKKRHLLGVVARYGASEEEAIKSVRRGQVHADPEHFAVLDNHGMPVGAASIYHNLRLFQQEMALPPLIARKINDSHEIVTTGPNIHAWTGKMALLGKAYTLLAERPGAENGWTIEPERSGLAVHSALLAAGFNPHDRARYDDGESDKRVPSKSVLYTLD